MNKAKTRTKYVCSNCGYDSLKWLGKCPDCGEWDKFVEEIVEVDKSKRQTSATGYSTPSRLSDITSKEEDRIRTNINEFDRVLGGGLMPGSVILIGGDPGIGKTTLVMQAASNIKGKILYVTGEESNKQIKLRAERLHIRNDNFFVLAETNLDNILEAIKQTQPTLVVIDSIQTIYNSTLINSAGTVTQIRECTSILMQNAKSSHHVIILIGHVTKEGIIAGPKVLEHVVDAVLQFEGERNYSFRILRAQKNRFGSTNEIGIFEMHDTGLSEVKNPSEILLGDRENITAGTVVTASIEGTRPILLEVQALVTPSNYGNPQRVATGFDYRRLSILLAVLEKRASMRLSTANVFLNMAGGLKIDEPAIDLAVCCSIASSLLEKEIRRNLVVVGEVGLGGEVRGISNIEKRIQEAEKLGFTNIIIPKKNFKSNLARGEIKITQVETLSEAISKVFV